MQIRRLERTGPVERHATVLVCVAGADPGVNSSPLPQAREHEGIQEELEWADDPPGEEDLRWFGRVTADVVGRESRLPLLFVCGAKTHRLDLGTQLRNEVDLGMGRAEPERQRPEQTGVEPDAR